MHANAQFGQGLFDLDRLAKAILYLESEPGRPVLKMAATTGIVFPPSSRIAVPVYLDLLF